MKLFRKYKELEQSATDRKRAVASSMEKVLRTLRKEGLYAFKNLSDEEQRRVWHWSKEVIRQYRRALERNPANIRPLDDLPLPKEKIKLAIKLALPFYAQKNIQSMVKNLRSIYKELGCFQSFDAADREKLRKSYARQDKATLVPSRQMLEIHEKYMETVVSEKKSLLAEINNFANKLEVLK
ncbi:MAG: hypothetical protein JSW26_14005 [Desulfobacterales bacterium]|nr:MAG: hypothetical protein JSW26_14005 [Desulfobacterales bacterium]